MDSNHSNFDEIKETIRRLKALADRPTNEHEAAKAAAHLARLLMEHNLAIEDIHLDQTASGDPMVEESMDFTGMRQTPLTNAPSWKIVLGAAVSKPCLCMMVWKSGVRSWGEMKPATFSFIGRKSNVEVASYLYTYLERTIAACAKVLRKNGHGAGRGRRWWNSWYLGCVYTVEGRLQAEQVTFEASGEHCRALVKNRLQEAGLAMREMYPHLNTYRTRASIELDGYSSGRKAGASIAIRPGINNSLQNQRLLQ
ncbi:MAG: DUF2786 domain-containing protein [Planctomycetes bacterium]|nr:DUF2786 domain-containing protein [Planctomycetota bacterium]